MEVQAADLEIDPQVCSWNSRWNEMWPGTLKMPCCHLLLTAGTVVIPTVHERKPRQRRSSKLSGRWQFVELGMLGNVLEWLQYLVISRISYYLFFHHLR
jgi:hypothetical protein